MAVWYDDPRDFNPMPIDSMGRGCFYCCMTGFEDYPTSKKPCRMGHPEMQEFLPMDLPEPTEGKPSEGRWKWTGNGWRNLDYKRGGGG